MKKLQEILNLVKETGDKLIVMDPEGDPYIVMNLANYRSLLREESKVTHLTEEELLEKINHLVASWKSGQPDLADYDLAQFRVNTIRQSVFDPEAQTRWEADSANEPRESRKATMAAPTYEPVIPAPELSVADERLARQEALLAQVIDRPEAPAFSGELKDLAGLDTLEDEQYYPEPQEEII